MVPTVRLKDVHCTFHEIFLLRKLNEPETKQQLLHCQFTENIKIRELLKDDHKKETVNQIQNSENLTQYYILFLQGKKRDNL